MTVARVVWPLSAVVAVFRKSIVQNNNDPLAVGVMLKFGVVDCVPTDAPFWFNGDFAPSSTLTVKASPAEVEPPCDAVTVI